MKQGLKEMRTIKNYSVDNLYFNQKWPEYARKHEIKEKDIISINSSNHFTQVFYWEDSIAFPNPYQINDGVLIVTAKHLREECKDKRAQDIEISDFKYVEMSDFKYSKKPFTKAEYVFFKDHSSLICLKNKNIIVTSTQK